MGITVGPDGTLWLTDAFTDQIERWPLSGNDQAYATPTPLSHPEGITVGPDGNLWFIEGGAGKIGCIVP
jgi:virginiamycin B lyase